MKEHPIIFNATSVKAILRGAKTETRRIPGKPRGDAGDRLWVKETWAQLCMADEIDGTCDLAYKADDWPADEPGPDCYTNSWRTPLFMPRWASRITLEITAIRTEQLHEIDQSGMIAEGFKSFFPEPESITRQRFITHWDAINAKRGFPWSSNPTVEVITFKVLNV